MYIRDFERVAKRSTTAREIYSNALGLYPDRANPGSLCGSARGIKGQELLTSQMIPNVYGEQA